MQRGDPFFKTRTPHQNGYIESLHRTYGEPRSALPKRNDESFAKALQFRQEEKTHYANLQHQNQTYKSQYEQMQLQFTQLKTETAELKELWEQLSKHRANADRRNRERIPADTGANSSASAPERGVDQPAESSADGGGGVRDTANEKAERPKVRRGVQREVLPPDTRGQAAEHPAEGPERGSGPNSATEEPEPANSV